MAKKKNTDMVKHIAVSLCFGFLFFILVANVLASQRIPELFFQITNDNEQAYITFLKQGRTTSSFRVLSPEILQNFARHEDEIYADERQRRELIQKLEVLLDKNPKSRDILYSLYLLYDKDEKHDVAQMYLQEAQKIDPSLK